MRTGDLSSRHIRGQERAAHMRPRRCIACVRSLHDVRLTSFEFGGVES